MHPILEIAIGVALGMTVFIVIVWVLGMAIYVCCNKNDCIATCKKTKSFKANKTQKLYVPSELKLSSEKITTYNDQNSSEKVEENKETIKEQ